jgi:hypothetical protein
MTHGPKENIIGDWSPVNGIPGSTPKNQNSQITGPDYAAFSRQY